MRLDHLLSRDTCCFFLHDEAAIPRSKLVGCAPQGVQTTSAHKKTEECWRGLVSEPEGWLVSTVQLSGTPDSYIYKPNNIITSILPRQEEREAEETRVCVCLDERACVKWRSGTCEEEAGAKQENTSEREYEVDA